MYRERDTYMYICVYVYIYIYITWWRARRRHVVEAVPRAHAAQRRGPEEHNTIRYDIIV